MGTFPDFSGKKRIIFIDNVSSDFAKNYGAVYPNAVFFTQDTDGETDVNEIWKGGQPYANYITVDENSNSIEIDGNIIRLSLDKDGCLRFISGYSWYWYVGYISYSHEGDITNNELKKIIFNQQNLPSINKANMNSNRPVSGWNIITNDNNITNPNIDSPEFESYLSTITSNVERYDETEIKITGNQFYSPHCDDDEYSSHNEIILNLGKIHEENIFKYNDKLTFIPINIIVPTTLVSKGLGLYDDLSYTNFFENAISNNYKLPDSKGIYYYNLGPKNKAGVKYNLYTIIIATEMPYDSIVNEVNMNFNLSLYIKSNNENK